MEEKKLEEKEYEYEELAFLWQDGKITSLQFVEGLPYYYTDWEEWLETNHRERDEQAADDYLDWNEQLIEKSFDRDDQYDIMDLAEANRQ